MSEDTGGAFTIGEHPVAPGRGTGCHDHKHMDEALFVLEGDLTFVVGERSVVAPTGSFLYVPRNVRHSITNHIESPARMLVVFSPPGFEGWWEDTAELWRANRVSPATRLAGDWKYGMEVMDRPWAAGS